MILDWLLCVVRGADQRPRGGVPLPPAPPCFLLTRFSPCFVVFAAYWSGPCGLYRQQTLFFVWFIKSTLWPLAPPWPRCLTLTWRLVCAWLGLPACQRVGPACRLLLPQYT